MKEGGIERGKKFNYFVFQLTWDCYFISVEGLLQYQFWSDYRWIIFHKTSKDVTLIVNLFLLSLQFYVLSNLFFNILYYIWIKTLLLSLKIYIHELIINFFKNLYIYLIALSKNNFWLQQKRRISLLFMQTYIAIQFNHDSMSFKS